MLTTAQLTALKADIAADPAFADLPHNSDGAWAVAAAYNLPASPAWTVWRTAVEAKQLMENGFIWTAVDNLTVGKARIWDWMQSVGVINPSRPNVRQGLVDCFGAGSAMVTAMLPYCKRTATRAEKLFAIGTGTDASPATMTFEGTMPYSDVEAAWAL